MYGYGRATPILTPWVRRPAATVDSRDSPKSLTRVCGSSAQTRAALEVRRAAARDTSARVAPGAHRQLTAGQSRTSRLAEVQGHDVRVKPGAARSNTNHPAPTAMVMGRSIPRRSLGGSDSANAKRGATRQMASVTAVQAEERQTHLIIGRLDSVGGCTSGTLIVGSVLLIQRRGRLAGYGA